MRTTIASLSLLAALLLASPAAAQTQPCDARGLDAFEAARRARRVVEDYTFLHRNIWRDLDALDVGTIASGRPLPELRLFGAPIVDIALRPGVPSCYEGQRRSSSLNAVRFGGIAGGEHRGLGLRMEAFWVAGGDTLTISIPNPDGSVSSSGEDPNDVVFGQGQRMIGGRIRMGRWAEITLGQLSDSSTSPDPRNPDNPPVEPARTYMAFGVPALNLQTDLIIDGRDQSLQTIYLDLNRLMIHESGLAVTARAGYLEDEEQVFTALGVAIPVVTSAEREQFTTPATADQPPVTSTNTHGSGAWLYPEVSMEWDSPRLRHARLRAEVQRTVQTIYDEDDAAFGMGAPYVDMGLFWEGTTFNSRAFEQRVGEEWAWGYGAGAKFLVGIRLMSIAVDTSFHLNRPETLAQLSELEGAGEWRLLLSWRIGW